MGSYCDISSIIFSPSGNFHLILKSILFLAIINSEFKNYIWNVQYSNCFVALFNILNSNYNENFNFVWVSGGVTLVIYVACLYVMTVDQYNIMFMAKYLVVSAVCVRKNLKTSVILILVFTSINYLKSRNKCMMPFTSKMNSYKNSKFTIVRTELFSELSLFSALCLVMTSISQKTHQGH